MNQKKLFSNLTAGFFIGILATLFAISDANLVFNGPLSPYLPVGIGVFIIGNIVVMLALTYASSYSGSIGSAQETPTVIMAIIAAGIFETMHGSVSEEGVLITVLVAIGD